MGFSAPLLNHILRRRSKQGKEDRGRINERIGRPAHNRPDKKLIWVHAASVGESLAVLALISKLLENYQKLSVMVTTGTVTSARLMEKRLPHGAFHQYIPMDHPDWVTRFMDHWHPDLVLWTESEFWPNLLHEIKKRSIPIALMNARLSAKSAKRWRFLPSIIKPIIENFSIILAQTQEDADALIKLGGRNVSTKGNLKYSSAPLPYSEHELKRLQDDMDKRPFWLFSSTHKGEEEQACVVHKILQKDFPNLLTIIVPRHPERREDIAQICDAHGLSYRLRSDAKFSPKEKDNIYIADTMGELGLFYRLAGLCCIGNSLISGGGHNPIEAAQLDTMIFYGPHMHNFNQICQEMETGKAVQPVKNAQDLAKQLKVFINSPKKTRPYRKAAKKLADEKSAVLDDLLAILAPLLTQSGIRKDTRPSKDPVAPETKAKTA